MKAFVLSTVAAALAIVPLSAASGAVMTIGGPLAKVCYKSALVARRPFVSRSTAARGRFEEESLRGARPCGDLRQPRHRAS